MNGDCSQKETLKVPLIITKTTQTLNGEITNLTNYMKTISVKNINFQELTICETENKTM